MKNIIFILLFIPVSILAQVEFAPLGAKWYYNLEANGNILNSHYNSRERYSDKWRRLSYIATISR